MTDAWPTEIKLKKDKKCLSISFDDGTAYDFPAEFLRVTSPSAEVQGHHPSERKTIGGKKDVEIMKVEPVGNYAIRLFFTDLHDSGFFTWDYFKQSGEGFDRIWQTYLEELEEKGLSRE
ncbi:DUF971 domain-containing protein [uncultured Cohaesibacter sp.]|uniref:DUF971 domain-containing protein n=1 Tax=uncultured Cohaesibacter sp. TaxID=1002546 RepID=UPI00292FE582|nr:DUF971 domain-containing protein [uncultured Cohaesibacter sp.]